MDPIETAEFVIAVQVAIMAVTMIVQAGKNDRAACAATGGGAKGGVHHHAVGRDLDIASWDNYPLGFLDRDGDDESGSRSSSRV